MDYYAIGQRIRKVRKALGLSQEELAEKVGISVTHMSHIETGNTKMSLDIFVKLVEALEVRSDDLLFDSPRYDKSAVSEKIMDTLSDCSAVQLRIIEDTVLAVKTSLRKNL